MALGSRFVAAAVLLAALPTVAAAQDRGGLCTAADDGTGTVELPPAGCAYLSPQEVHMIIDGLPPGTTIEIDPIHSGFLCINTPCGQPGGIHGGQYEDFESWITFEMQGTGDLTGFERTLTVPLMCQTHTGPRTPGEPVQTFPTEMFVLQGSLPLGDPDFDVLNVVAGTDNGLPSPGDTTLTQLDSGSFAVDSFFDISYRIDFVGAPGGPLDGLSGSTTGTLRMAVESPPDPPQRCVATDNGTGTVTLPPEDCKYVGPAEVHMMINGLPPSTTIELEPIHRDFICTTVPCEQPGGSLGGEVEVFDSTLDLHLTGTGELEGFSRTLSIPVASEVYSAPRTPGDPVQHLQTDMNQLFGEIIDDQDFSLLRVTAGTANGLPSPGQTTLTDQGDGTFMVDSFFDVYYQIEFTGAPGSVLYGMSGTTRARAGMTAAAYQADLAVTKDDGQTTAVPGEQLTYTVTLTNHGPNAMDNVILSDYLVPELTNVGWTCAGSGGATCNPSGTGDIDESVDLPNGGMVTFLVTATIASSASGTLDNTATATVAGGFSDPDPSNNSATDSDTLTPQADLVTTKTDGQTEAVPGTPITYIITVTNNGPSDAVDTTIADDFPDTLAGVSWTCTPSGGAVCTASGSGDLLQLVDLPAGGQVTYTVNATVVSSATGTLVNLAVATAPDGTTDPVPANNSATDSDTLTPQADLAVTKTDGRTNAAVGWPVTYTITVANNGPSDTGATVVDTFSAKLTGVTWTCAAQTGASCSASGNGNINDTISLAATRSVTYTATGTVADGATGSLINTATVTASGGTTDPPGNNSATDTDAIVLPDIFADGFESGNTSAWSSRVP